MQYAVDSFIITVNPHIFLVRHRHILSWVWVVLPIIAPNQFSPGLIFITFQEGPSKKIPGNTSKIAVTSFVVQHPSLGGPCCNP